MKESRVEYHGVFYRYSGISFRYNRGWNHKRFLININKIKSGGLYEKPQKIK
ncbi:hypothetical protein KAW18_04085 [candidate division WOR-3 bacterium]|nr:hypothetical protein [candidate division WOR-3 bacterium]MCK4526528.1 hypothetical protein [candidate division WOR-3 bacterium]